MAATVPVTHGASDNIDSFSTVKEGNTNQVENPAAHLAARQPGSGLDNLGKGFGVTGKTCGQLSDLTGNFISKGLGRRAEKEDFGNFLKALADTLALGDKELD
ncbi:hypothetical protein AAF712_011420 [Marasmius tenuissimus]|uniref:Uncharacterized protein n=1 Tax=Marasmius tenuissimus TaxID=585030 RepID=A0ABR2ZKQ0_9AGAR